MARPLKYLEGDVITDVCDVVVEVLHRRYVICRGQRQHPSWVTSQQLQLIATNTRKGHYRFAVPNPKHPDNQKEPQ